MHPLGVDDGRAGRPSQGPNVISQRVSPGPEAPPTPPTAWTSRCLAEPRPQVARQPDRREREHQRQQVGGSGVRLTLARREPEPVTDIVGARILGLFLDSITTDHISPAGNIREASPAGKPRETSTRYLA